MKLREIYSSYLDKFKENNISELSLRIILCHIFKINDMSEFYIRQEDNFLMTKKDEKSILKVLSGTPVYYVTKEADFYNFKFNVNKNVFIIHHLPYFHISVLTLLYLPFLFRWCRLVRLSIVLFLETNPNRYVYYVV